MINTDRIVPSQAQDLLSIYGVAMDFAGLAPVKVSVAEGPGIFSLTEQTAGNLLADEPAKSFDFGSAVTSATIYFIPAYDYAGFSKDGSEITPTGVVEADGRTLYKAVLASGAVTITKVGF